MAQDDLGYLGGSGHGHTHGPSAAAFSSAEKRAGACAFAAVSSHFPLLLAVAALVYAACSIGPSCLVCKVQTHQARCDP